MEISGKTSELTNIHNKYFRIRSMDHQTPVFLTKIQYPEPNYVGKVGSAPGVDIEFALG
jgi:hypothetical protein